MGQFCGRDAALRCHRPRSADGTELFGRLTHEFCPVPEGLPIIARRFNAGTRPDTIQVPKGRLNLSRHLGYFPSAAAASRYWYRAATMLKRIATTNVNPAYRKNRGALTESD